jgi:hypothetical protein
MTERDAKLAQLQAHREKWLRERQAELDRERVIAELGAAGSGMYRSTEALKQ